MQRLKPSLLSQFDLFLAALAALYLPLSLIHWFIHYVQFIPNHTNLSCLCFAKHNAAHHDERTMSHTMFRHHYFNKISKFWQNFTIFTEFHNFDQSSQNWQNFPIFSCPSIIVVNLLRALQTIRTWPTCPSDLPSWPTYPTYLPDLPTWPTIFL